MCLLTISTCVIKDQKIIVIINKNCMIEDLEIYEDREEAVGKGGNDKDFGQKSHKRGKMKMSREKLAKPFKN